MRNLRYSALFAVGAGLFLPLSVHAQIGGSASHPFFHAQIQVQVRTADNEPPPRGVLVELQGEDGTPIDQTQTDSSGKCIFTPPAPTIYLIRARMPGYIDATARVDLQNVMTGFAMLTLKPIPGQAPLTGITLRGGAGAAVSAADLGVPDDSRKEFEKGQQLLQANNVDDGISHLQKAIQLHDSFPQAYTMLGTAYNQQKKWKEAETALQKAVKLDPKAAEAYIQLGAALNQTKDYAGAEKALTKGLELNPEAQDAPEAHYELAKTYWALGQWQNAEPHIAKALAARPDLAPAHVLMGNICLRKGDGPGAIKEYQDYLRLEPKGSMAGPAHDMIAKIEVALKKK